MLHKYVLGMCTILRACIYVCMHEYAYVCMYLLIIYARTYIVLMHEVLAIPNPLVTVLNWQMALHTTFTSI